MNECQRNSEGWMFSELIVYSSAYTTRDMSDSFRLRFRFSNKKMRNLREYPDIKAKGSPFRLDFRIPRSSLH